MNPPHLCPRCAPYGLYRATVRDLEIEPCGACGGVWLTEPIARRILGRFAGDEAAPATPSSTPSELRCPECRLPMVVGCVPGTEVPVDTCAGHGTWFDRDEVASLTVAAASRRAEVPPHFEPSPAPGSHPHVIAGAAAAAAAHGLAHADALARADALATRERASSTTSIAADVVLLPDPIVTVELVSVAGETVTQSVQLASAGVEALAGGAEALVGGVEGAEGILDVLAGFFDAFSIFD
ncbi:MAG: hypothetical protein R3B09_11690 [Nannocystaceae bacterium]